MHNPKLEIEHFVMNELQTRISKSLTETAFQDGLLLDATRDRVKNYKIVWNSTRTRCAAALFSYSKTAEVKKTNKQNG